MYGSAKIWADYEAGLSGKVIGCLNLVSFHEDIIYFSLA